MLSSRKNEVPESRDVNSLPRELPDSRETVQHCLGNAQKTPLDWEPLSNRMIVNTLSLRNATLTTAHLGL